MADLDHALAAREFAGLERACTLLRFDFGEQRRDLVIGFWRPASTFASLIGCARGSYQEETRTKTMQSPTGEVATVIA